MKDLTIGALARRGNVGVETIRYYQRRGLLRKPPPPGNGGSAGGIRHYDEDDVSRLRFIRTAQTAGFTLEQISELLELDATQDRARAHTLATRRLTELDRKIEELTAARSALKRLTDACGAGDEGPCPIIEAFEPD